jgi:phosphatidylinositol alpha-1,6-mannosyltransferase
VIEGIVHVSANLRLDGGGAAHFGRLCGGTLRAYCERRGLLFRGLHLAPSDADPDLDGYQSYGGVHSRLAFGAALRQLAAPRRWALFFDHLGPARLESYLPAGRRAAYDVAILGIEVWQPLGRDRRRALAGARRVIAISRHTVERARPYLPAGCAVSVVWPAIEERWPTGAVDQECLARAGEGFVLAVGRMPGSERYKGHDELLEALAALRPVRPAARLVFAGDGDDRPRLEERSRELGLRDSVFFTGAVSEATLRELYGRAAVFALPSRGEGFGLVFLEAMRAGKPCVAYAGTAPAEIVVDGETGLLVPALDRDALVAALDGLLAAGERARRMGEAGRRRWRELFTPEAFARRLEPEIDRLANGDHVRN